MCPGNAGNLLFSRLMCITMMGWMRTSAASPFQVLLVQFFKPFRYKGEFILPLFSHVRKEAYHLSCSSNFSTQSMTRDNQLCWASPPVLVFWSTYLLASTCSSYCWPEPTAMNHNMGANPSSLHLANVTLQPESWSTAWADFHVLVFGCLLACSFSCNFIKPDILQKKSLWDHIACGTVSSIFELNSP